MLVKMKKTEATIKLETSNKEILLLILKAAINELEMMRVLAATGLTISEFVHEIKQNNTFHQRIYQRRT